MASDGFRFSMELRGCSHLECGSRARALRWANGFEAQHFGSDDYKKLNAFLCNKHVLSVYTPCVKKDTALTYYNFEYINRFWYFLAEMLLSK